MEQNGWCETLVNLHLPTLVVVKLNFKFVSEPCKKSVFVINMIPSNINISKNTILNTYYNLHQGLYTFREDLHNLAVHTRVHTSFLTDKH